MKRFIALAWLLICFAPLSSLEIGGGYNEEIADITYPVLAKAGVKWVRAYVNLTRNYITYQDPLNSPPENPNPINGVVDGNITQNPDHVSFDVDVLAVASLDKLIYAKSVLVNCEPIKIIFSLKQDFTYPYQDVYPYGNVPTTQSEFDYLFEAIEGILETNNRGAYIDILVVGNEPMFEVQPNDKADTATKYTNYLNFLVPKLALLKASKGWNFEIFVGALNRPSYPNNPPNTIIPAVLDFLQNNSSLVGGIDLHEHVMEPTDVLNDILFVKQYLQPNQKIISSEFSIIELFNAHQNDYLGSWGKRHGYPPEWQLYNWINYVIEQASIGTPISKKHFMSYFKNQPWYPRHWFKQMVDIFKQQGVYAVTYGLEENPIYPWNQNFLSGSGNPWVLNAVYNGTLFGISLEGHYNTNPLVYLEFKRAVRKNNHYTSPWCCNKKAKKSVKRASSKSPHRLLRIPYKNETIHHPFYWLED